MYDYFDYVSAPRPWTRLAGKGCGTRYQHVLLRQLIGIKPSLSRLCRSSQSYNLDLISEIVFLPDLIMFLRSSYFGELFYTYGVNSPHEI